LHTDQTAAPAAPQITRHGIALLAWPTEEPARRVLAASRIPRMLMVAAESPPPVITDSLEDWIRDPIDAADLDARSRALAHRAGIPPTPPGAPVEDTAPSERSSWVIDDADIERLVLASAIDERPAPAVDADNGVIRVGRSWVAVSELQLPVLKLLVERFGSIVPRAELAAVYGEVSGSTDPAALKSMMLRLSRRVRRAGLALQIVRGRGFLLEHADPTGPGTVPSL
jgi:DNA-binding response OmpR family regulator